MTQVTLDARRRIRRTCMQSRSSTGAVNVARHEQRRESGRSPCSHTNHCRPASPDRAFATLDACSVISSHLWVAILGRLGAGRDCTRGPSNVAKVEIALRRGAAATVAIGRRSAFARDVRSDSADQHTHRTEALRHLPGMHNAVEPNRCCPRRVHRCQYMYIQPPPFGKAQADCVVGVGWVPCSGVD